MGTSAERQWGEGVSRRAPPYYLQQWSDARAERPRPGASPAVRFFASEGKWRARRQALLCPHPAGPLEQQCMHCCPLWIHSVAMILAIRRDNDVTSMGVLELLKDCLKSGSRTPGGQDREPLGQTARLSLSVRGPRHVDLWLSRARGGLDVNGCHWTKRTLPTVPPILTTIAGALDLHGEGGRVGLFPSNHLHGGCGLCAGAVGSVGNKSACEKCTYTASERWKGAPGVAGCAPRAAGYPPLAKSMVQTAHRSSGGRYRTTTSTGHEHEPAPQQI